MRNREHEIVLGVIVFIAAVIVVVGTVWLSEKYAGASGGYRLRVAFDSVPGLQVGNPVTFRGVWVGKVLSIALDKGHPVVTLGFARIQGLPKDSQILLKSDGLLGGQMIEILLGASHDTWPEDALVQGISSQGLEQVMLDGGQLVSRVNATVDRVASEENLAHLSQTMAQMDSTARMLNVMLSRNQAKVNALFDSLAMASGDAGGILRENRAEIQASAKNLRISSERLARFSEELEAASASMRASVDDLSQITGQIRAGKGTVGRLVQDEQMYDQLERTLTTIDSLVKDVQRNPTRYFHFSIF